MRRPLLISGPPFSFNNSKLYNFASTNVIVADVSDSGPIMTASMASQPVPMGFKPIFCGKCKNGAGTVLGTDISDNFFTINL